ncbi:DNA polymerase IV [Candidatus Methylobacter oryzae]|uniref:DNA polymerase IV n=1 Tax=Candidatus Methylobacter oryzae TaxID=2497749 RepID=A0ABY3C9D4_9GAMM|nr:DNA polymerase IV [Candidatus Methylobacter oryzae]TRW93294.1 DNA polymerase IV [Candidatus Methylobacter oryzae]
MSSIRKIIHIDMDAFFAAVEQRDFPQYRNKPLVVGGSPDSRGVVATCSYEARKYGIHSAMPSAHAYRLCPHAIFVKPRFEAYQQASTAIRKIFADYTDLFEPLSLDEAYLDVSNADLHQGSATLIAKAIKAAITQETQLTASAGVSYNKFFAKIASDINKPDGFYLITPEQGPEFAERLPVEKFHGIGKATLIKMHSLGIKTGKDLKSLPLETLQHYFGKAGLHYYNISRGIDNRPVNNYRARKSLGVEITFQQDVKLKQDVIVHLQSLLEKALSKAAEKQLNARTLTIKIKYHDFVQITRSRTLPYIITAASTPVDVLDDLLRNTDVGSRNVRLLGVALSSLDNNPSQTHYRQLDLFNDC